MQRPGIYARAFLEGRLSEEQLDHFRQEVVPGQGLSSYPHPRLMPDFWEFPTVSMGIGPLSAIYQARFNRYLHNRGIKDTSGSRVWAFLGDGEMDEPESLGALSIAAREGLDNLTFVVNCNLQRLDGPVRGNGKIVQELESVFRGAGWNVVKVVWGREWDALLARDIDGALVHRMGEVLDGESQKYAVESGAYIREHFFGADPRLLALVEGYTDEQIKSLRRGGHDHRKVYAAYRAAIEHTGRPTVVLAQTVKGWTLGPGVEARNITHQAKKLSEQELRIFRDRLELPIPDAQLKDAPYFRPAADSPEQRYIAERRAALGGASPRRVVISKPLDLPAPEVFGGFDAGSGTQEASTTMAFARLMRDLIRDKGIGKRIVPIIPDEARTFGMDPLFKEVGIYTALGQRYDPVDSNLVLSYREATDGQVLEEGITEAGSAASFQAAGTAYASHARADDPVLHLLFHVRLPAHRRTSSGRSRMHAAGASCWVAPRAAPPSTARASSTRTATRWCSPRPCRRPRCTTQHSPTRPRPSSATASAGCTGWSRRTSSITSRYTTRTTRCPPGRRASRTRISCAACIASGPHPSCPVAHPGRPSCRVARSCSRLSGRRRSSPSGTAWPRRSGAPPSYQLLRNEALGVDRWNLLHPGQTPRVPRGQPAAGRGRRSRPDHRGERLDPSLAGHDLALDPGDAWCSLGTDGFGRSDSRAALRRFFGVDTPHIVAAALSELARCGQVPVEVAQSAIGELGVDPEAPFSLTH